MPQIRTGLAKVVVASTLALACSTTLTLAQPRVQSHQAGRVEMSPSEAATDFDVLHRALSEAHGGYARFSPRIEIDRRMAEHRARLTRPMTKLEFAGIVSEALAELRDGHARLEFDSVTSAAVMSARLFPLRIQLEGSRMVVLLNDTPTDSTIRPGMEVTSINGRSVEVLVKELLPKVSGDGFVETGRRTRLAREFGRLYWLFIEQADSYAIMARDAGRSVTATLPGVLERDRRTTANPVNVTIARQLERLDGPSGNIVAEFLENDIARLRIRAFGGADFRATLDSVFQALRERGTKGLILDLRGNGGGVDQYGALLVAQFVARPFRYFDRIQITTRAPSFATWLPRTFEEVRLGTIPDSGGGFLVTAAYHSGVGEQAPARQPFQGKLVVLIDGGSFSTTADVAAQLRSMGRATFVGEETAGTYEGNISGLNALIVLPHSGLRTKIMMYGYWNAVRPPTRPGRGTIPDHVATRRVADVLAGRDPVLERAIAVAR
jgi:hypothetical protein